MKKFSFTTTEYVETPKEEFLAHPPVEENMADGPMVVEFEEGPYLEEGGPALFETPEEAIEHAFGLPEDTMEVADAPMIVTFDEEGEELEELEELEGLENLEDIDGEGLFEEILEQIGYEEGREDEEEDSEDDKGDKEDDKDEKKNDAIDPMSQGVPGLSDQSEQQMSEVRPEGRRIPGTQEYIYDEPEPDPEPEKITNWTDDRDPSKFMDYLAEAINRFNTEGVPGHDGRSMVGVQRAIEMLKRLDREISEAIRKDVSNDIDANQVEKYRENIEEYISTLKEHLGKLKKRSSTSQMEETLISMGRESLEKEATVARIQVVMTPFERAISGILINSVISGGKPFEDVYEFLKDKYKLTDREELAILQIAMDSGFPIFKDRGTIGESNDGKSNGHGVDFIKNYFG